MAEKNLQLVIIEGPGKGTAYRLTGKRAVIGRSPECDIRLQNTKGVSRTHAEIHVMEDRLRIHDLGSSNGTEVEGQKVGEAILLPGVSIKIGAVTFKLKQSGGAMPVAATPRAEVSKANSDNPVGQAYGGSDQGVSPYEAFDDEAGASKKRVTSLLLMAAIIVVVISGGIYVLGVVSQPATFDPRFRNLRVRERQAVDFGTRFDKAVSTSKDQFGKKIVLVEDYTSLPDALLKSSLKSLGRTAPHRRMLVLTGLAKGDAVIELKSKGGSTYGYRDIVVRGIEPYVFAPTIPRTTAREMAIKAESESKALEKDGELYLAWKKMELAAELYNGPAEDAEKADALEGDAWMIQQRLAKKVSKLFTEGLMSAFPSNAVASPPDFSVAMSKLQEVKSLIRDDESVDWQVVDHWQNIMRAEQMKRADGQ